MKTPISHVAPAPLRAVLIDLNGTMVHTAPDIVEAANRMLKEFGRPPLAASTVTSFIGRGVPNLVRRALEAAELHGVIDGAEALAALHRHYANTNGQFGCVFPGVEAGLAELRRLGYRLGCVTNKPQALAAPLLTMTGLAGYLDVLVAGDSGSGMKPDPEPLRHACRLLGVDAACAVMIGDSSVDVSAARAAGMPVLIVSYGYGGPHSEAAFQCDALIDSMTQAPACLAARENESV